MNAARYLLSVTLALAGMLGACSEEGRHTVAPTPTTGAYLAMARGQVDVEGGLIRIATPRDGRVDAVEVEDGDTVKQGDVLARLDQRQTRADVGVAAANLDQAEAQVGVLKARLPQARQQAERVAAAAGADAASGQSADEAKSALVVLNAEIAVASASVKVMREHLDAARAGLDALTVKAPATGRIVRRSVHVGDMVSAQSSTEMFELLPDRPRIVRAELNEAYVDKVTPGMQAEVVRDSDQGKTYAARVLRVGEVFGPSKLTDDPVERAGAHDVECVLALDTADLRIGQRVLVRFRR